MVFTAAADTRGYDGGAISLPIPCLGPFLQQHVVDQVCLGRVGNVDILLYPSKQGFSSDQRGLPWDMYGFRLKF